MTTVHEHPTFAEGPSPYHFGQKAVQSRAGVRDSSEDRGRRVIRKYMNEQAKAFFEELPYLFVSVKNADGSLWATTLCGQPGFMKAVDDFHLRIRMKQMFGDPAQFRVGTVMGSVGVMLHNRRRNKLNGVVESLDSNRLSLRITHSLGNCPKYIQVRTVVLDSDKLASLGDEKRSTSHGGTFLGQEQLSFIARSDTAFLATSFSGCPEGKDTDTKEYCNINHRGGSPGFVKVVDDSTLLLPDYVGNDLYQSLGNIFASPNAGLQFIDFSTGDSLQLTGGAQVLFDDRTLPGALRAVRFSISKWVYVKRGLPFSTRGAVEPSPYNPTLQTANGAGGKRLKCVGRRRETHDIETFRFVLPPRDDGKAFCEAGQFASFDFPNIKGGTTLNRTWTISSAPEEIERTGAFTISVKKAGLVSTWLHEKVTVGRDVIFRGVDGDFTLDRAAKCIPSAGVLLIAGGIGITPMRVMFAECLRRKFPVVLLYSFRTKEDAAFLNEFKEAIHGKSFAQLAITMTGEPSDIALDGLPVFHGRITAATIQKVCPDVAAREVFQCGPQAMMNSATSALEGLGVPATHIHHEAFNF